ncbi:MAG: TolC family protein [Planctomycetota bacterium]
MLPRSALASFPLVASLIISVLGACSLAPEGTESAFDAHREAGSAWRKTIDQRELPELPAQPSLDDFVTRALLANRELEAEWHAWRAALENVLAVSGWPNSELAVEVTTLLSGGWDTTAVAVGFNPMAMLQLPVKPRTAGHIALEQALAAAQRFAAQRLALRADAITQGAEWSLLGERLAVQELRVELLASLERQSGTALSVGGGQADLLERQVDLENARLELAALRAEVGTRRARLNALMHRAPDAPLPLPVALPTSRLLAYEDAAILAAGAVANPELAALAHEVAARKGELARARQAWIPDVSPTVEAADGMDDSLSLMVTLPVAAPAVQAAIRRARAEWAEAEARLDQARFDRGAELVEMLAALRNDERRVTTLVDAIQPAAAALVDSSRLAYTTGGAALKELVEAQSLALDARLALAEARVAREVRLAQVERLAGRELQP